MAGGGAEIQLFRNIKIFQDLGFSVTLVHCSDTTAKDLDLVPQSWGISIAPVKLITAFPRINKLLGLFASPHLSLFRYSLALRHASSIALNYYLVHTVIGECTFNHPKVLQHFCIPLFSLRRSTLSYLGVSSHTMLHLIFRRIYILVCRSISLYSRTAISSHYSLSNSIWTSFVVKSIYPSLRSVQHLYFWPELVTPSRTYTLSERNPRIVILGRIVPSKNIDQAVRIRDIIFSLYGISLELSIVGRGDMRYATHLASKSYQPDQVKTYRDLPRSDLLDFLSSSLIGLHCYQFEHFGSAACEMRMSGLPTFVPNKGGQSEITTSDYTYNDSLEAATKIFRLISNPELYNYSAIASTSFFATNNSSLYSKQLSSCICASFC